MKKNYWKVGLVMLVLVSITLVGYGTVFGYGGGNGEGTISGQKFHDLNNDGDKDPGEPGLSGWEITIYKTPNFGNGIRTMITDSNGNYEWTNVPHSNYVLCETPQSGWTQTAPSGGSTVDCSNGTDGYSIDMPGGPASEDNTFTDVDFGNRTIEDETITVTDVKYIDGERATAETANNTAFNMFAEWRATNIGNGSGAFDLDVDGFNFDPTPYQAITSPMTVGADYRLTEQNVPTTCNGDNAFALDGYKVGNTEAQALAGPLWTNDNLNAHLTNIQENKFILVMNRTCETTPTGSISGMKFNDLNNNGTLDDGEPGLTGWTIRAYYRPTQNTFEETITDVNGNYTFSDLALDQYNVCEATQVGWDQTFPAETVDNHCPNNTFGYKTDITEDGESFVDLNFGNHNPPPPGDDNPPGNDDDGEEEDNGNGSRRSGNRGSSATTGQVLGAAIGPEPLTCSEYLQSYLRVGQNNPIDQMTKLQMFLNEFKNAGLALTGFFDAPTFQAVKAFQVGEEAKVRVPWAQVGNPITESEWPTGFVYITTRHRINEIVCSTLNAPLPSLVPASAK